jgi:hypothetical protein
MWDEGQGKASQWGKGLKGKGHERGPCVGSNGGEAVALFHWAVASAEQ